ncbi:MAG TPA: FAD-dependent oxidoreductase, partial [Mycolicibacillus parakoreensis]|nr:FAD-dependent oxidoreductase [Mycolicibacillus parakoreensis]
CVDCGACVRACPVDAISPDSLLPDSQLPFLAVNASYYPEREPGTKLPPTSKLAPIMPAPELRRGPLSVAIVGSGPAAMYAADELLTQPRVRVSMFEKLPTPYGLVRAGVAPDHQSTKRITRLFDQITRRDGFSFYLNVEVGNHIGHHELLAHHHAVIYASGAPNDRRLDVEGMGLAGTGTATEVVAWINGHPDFVDLPVDLSHERAVLIGNGNVALDVARVLTRDPATLARTDISDAALAALSASNISEVVIAARRGPAQSAFTLPELIGLTGVADVVLDADDHALVRRDLAEVTDRMTRNKLEILTNLPDAAEVPLAQTRRPRIRFAYQRTPRRVIGERRATGIEFQVTGTDEVVSLDAGLVLTSIGYRGKPIRDLPFDEASATVPNDHGRVLHAVTGARIPGAYVAGWIKRGPTGFIGTNKSCSMQTVQQLVDDFNAELLPDPIGKTGALQRLLQIRQPDLIDAAGWQAIDAAEIARGAAADRPRNKFTSVPDMVAVAAAAPKPTLRQRISDKIHQLV